jgi:ATP-dependent 26S proteasome regulatory subunit
MARFAEAVLSCGPMVRYQAVSATGDIQAIVTHGRGLLTRAVRRAWETQVLTKDPDGLFSGVLGAADIEKLIARAEAGELDAPAAAPAVAASARAPVQRLRVLLESIGCLPVAEDVLAIGLAIELDATSRTRVGYLRGNSLGAALTVGTLVLAMGEERTPELLVTMGAGAPLRRHRLVEVVDKAGELVAAATVRAAPRLLRWLVDPAGMDDEVSEFTYLIQPEREPAMAPAGVAACEEAIEETKKFLERQRARVRSTNDLVLRGPRGAGRGEIAREACRRLGLPVLVAPVGSLLGQANPPDAVGALLREALLLDAQLLLEGWEVLPAQDEASQRLRSALSGSSRPLLITSTALENPRIGNGRAMVVREVKIVSANVREEIWTQALPEINAVQTASLYRVGVGAIGRVSDGARLRASVRGEEVATAVDVAAAVRSEFETDLGTVAQRVEVSQTWEDLVVPDDTGRTIAELVEQLRHRSTVLGRWGFQRKLGKGLGTTALFSGEPGTGKSMVAGLISRELGLELYQIDLSRVLSKWIGETEKNLARVFDAAETGHVVLLFDEADSLLGKRTSDTKNANDRYANIETNYILQRLEAFHGVAILTSNLESSIDPALSRRLSFELRFPFPDEEQRAEIWRRMLPVELPVEGSIDYDLLAERFELSGGYIRNIVLRAAYLAASDGTSLTQAHLLRAAEYEYRDHGMLIARGRLT